MASGLIFDPYALLRVAPLASSTGSLVHATVELTVNSAFLLPSLRKQSDALLPAWYGNVFYREVVVVVALNLTSLTSAIANIYLAPDSRPWPLSRTTFYWLGLMGTIGHMLFVPLVAPPIQRMVEDTKAENEASKEMDTWLSLHRVRMLVADLPAWIAFVGSALVV
ncbi:putative integral membrane protein [Aspergillus heteromorphus CBS 117.55]|uniref:Putative integral membrane protein n=1 Tax=Aspergillus heteromorphus CBS 117.55 TaxID=1448321 RepID=A0A317VL61_9EURO|nr:putative integral membrane protein [Aspergillus heteromorphus CBS 117.55]PWY74309.1 putative integral membrane protein [Aspergillus heteromorphus CBS 117.55]